MSRNWIIAGAAAVCLIVGIVLSHRIEPGVRVQKVTLAGETPALEFIPAGPGPHPVALLAHGYAGSKETLFRYGEALAAAGFIGYDVDLPGHGASPRTYTSMDTVHALEAVAREVGPVDVFVGHSMGGFTGGEAVREGGMKPGLFIAVGSFPVLGDHAPPLLLLSGRFEEAFMLLHITPALLKTRTDAQVVIAPWSEHLLEAFDPVLVNAAVEAACVAVHKTPPPPSAWRWRLIGAVLAMLAAGKLASCLTDLSPQLARFRGVFIGVFITAVFMLTLGGRWLDAIPHLRLQVIAVPVAFLLVMIAGKLRIPRWSFAVLNVLVLLIAVCWLKASYSWAAFALLICAVILTPALIAGIVIGWAVACRGSRLQGDIAMAIFVGCAAFQCLEPPRTLSEVPKPHDVIKLDAKLLDACIGEYEFAPDNVFFTGMKLTIRRKGDHLVGRALGRNALPGALDVYPESETNFLVKINGAQLTFIKNDKGAVTAVIHHMAGLPDSMGKKLKK
jgi:pimeloyl-ACP methyl ester carboxylesterase